MMLGALVRMLSALEPERDCGPLARVYNHLRQTAAPSRDKLLRLVRASDLFELGLRLMDTCEEGANRPGYEPIRYRDGLLMTRLPRSKQHQPDRDRLAIRFEQFKRAA